MGKWLDQARQREMETCADSVFSADSSKFEPNGTKDTKDTHRRSPSLVVREWRSALAKVDPRLPLNGYPAQAWRDFYDDAAWLLDKFGDQASRDGWSTADLFGLWPGKPHWGGIADRLQGSRPLVMDADRASWRSWGQVERFNRGAYPDLKPFWRDQDPNPEIEVIP